MKRKRSADEQIASVRRQAEAGTSMEQIGQRLGISEPTMALYNIISVSASARRLDSSYITIH